MKKRKGTAIVIAGAGSGLAAEESAAIAAAEAKPDYTLINWPPSRGPVDPFQPPPWEVGEVRLERRETAPENRDGYLEPLVEPPKGWKLLQTVGERTSRVFHRSRRGAKPITKKVDDLTVGLNGHVATIASLTIDQAVHLDFWSVSAGNPAGTIRDVEDGLRALVKRAGSSEVGLTVRLDYPLGGLRAAVEQSTCYAVVLAEPVTRNHRDHMNRLMSTSTVLWQLAKAYERVYAEEAEDIAAERPGRWGIWGHGIRDLYFESLTIGADGTASVGIRS